MKQIYKDCKPTICGKDIMSNDNIFMTKDVIEEQCDCVSKDICIRVVDLFSKNQVKEAQDLFAMMYDDWKMMQ